MNKEVVMYTDGSCIDNSVGGGRGGYCAILVSGQHERIVAGNERGTTNNRMEMCAVIAGLAALKYPCSVTIVTDSEYVKNGVTQWMMNWKRNGWKASNGKPVKNRELWIALEDALSHHSVQWEWVRGHNGHGYNERADAIAYEQAQKA